MIHRHLLGKEVLIALLLLAECRANEVTFNHELITPPQEKVKYRPYNWRSLFSPLPQRPTENSVDSCNPELHQFDLELSSLTSSDFEYRGYITRGSKLWALISVGEEQRVFAAKNKQLLLENIKVVEIHPEYVRLEQHFWNQVECRINKKTFVLEILSTAEEKHLADS
ncbi:hypothetical protein [Vibrio sp. 99-8-1]|uniref:hypothetical protein n=1 Tax=Vibrio sp. 99-8-1 TaxID=2607602 RepID=UPI001493A357|nr:hypothetical protein [Vibrio sp. 99-8-1]NOI68654.1 pilus assembly protein PilP [Vibrio sp. 99-8-1]